MKAMINPEFRDYNVVAIQEELSILNKLLVTEPYEQAKLRLSDDRLKKIDNYIAAGIIRIA